MTLKGGLQQIFESATCFQIFLLSVKITVSVKVNRLRHSIGYNIIIFANELLFIAVGDILKSWSELQN